MNKPTFPVRFACGHVERHPRPARPGQRPGQEHACNGWCAACCAACRARSASNIPLPVALTKGP